MHRWQPQAYCMLDGLQQLAQGCCSLWEELRQHAPQQQVCVCDGEVSAFLVADWPRVRLGRLRADNKEAVAEKEAAATARGHSVDIQLRRLNGHTCCGRACMCGGDEGGGADTLVSGFGALG
eukprot:365133-Chlamydomonas_euryale.AAC.4